MPEFRVGERVKQSDPITYHTLISRYGTVTGIDDLFITVRWDAVKPGSSNEGWPFLVKELEHYDA